MFFNFLQILHAPLMWTAEAMAYVKMKNVAVTQTGTQNQIAQVNKQQIHQINTQLLSESP